MNATTDETAGGNPVDESRMTLGEHLGELRSRLMRSVIVLLVAFAVLYANSHSRSRIVAFESRSGVYARLRENVLPAGSAPATHGSPYMYDRHVPLIFLGGRIPSGNSTEPVATVDVAPTLARLAGIPVPNDLDGRVLDAVLR